MTTAPTPPAAPDIALRRTRHLLWLLTGLLSLLLVLLAALSIVETRRERADDRAVDAADRALEQLFRDAGGASASGQGTLIAPPRALQDFTLPSASGVPLALGDLRGRAVVLFFGFTRCPDFCPTTLGQFKQVKRALGPAAEEVAFVFVSVDSERDPPETLARYLRNFDPDFIGLSGDEATLRRIGPDYGLYYRQRRVEGSGAYLVDHTSLAYLIDRQGHLRVVFPYGAPAEGIAADVRALLAER